MDMGHPCGAFRGQGVLPQVMVLTVVVVLL